jgi:hypothetical protein
LLLVMLLVLVEGLIDEDDELDRLLLESTVDDDVKLGRDEIDEEEVDVDRTLLLEDEVGKTDEDDDERETLAEEVDRVELDVELAEDVDEVKLIDELEDIGSTITFSENTLM